MSTVETEFERFLDGHDEADWAATLSELLPAIHEVDRNATRVWFAFFPLALQRALAQSDDPERLAQKLLLQGRYRLKDQIDTAHTFVYGHRFWPEVKGAVAAHAAAFDARAPLAAQIRDVARAAAAPRRADESLLVGITAVAFMTVQQVGLAAFKATPGAVALDAKQARRTPEQVLAARARDDSQGLFGFLRTTDKRWTVVWDENEPTARFQMINEQEVASAAATDKRDWWQRDPRCTVGEGPIPVQCRSASCGTCWVGVLGGAENLSETEWRERKMMPLFGYIETDEPKPLVRLSCQARAEGPVSVVIPPWNGYFGKHLKRQGAGAGEEAGEAVASS